MKSLRSWLDSRSFVGSRRRRGGIGGGTGRRHRVGGVARRRLHRHRRLQGQEGPPSQSKALTRRGKRKVGRKGGRQEQGEPVERQH